MVFYVATEIISADTGRGWEIAQIWSCMLFIASRSRVSIGSSFIDSRR